MKVYVASSWRNPHQPEVVRALRDDGHEVYDFRAPHLGPGKRGVGFHWSEIDPAWKTWDPETFRRALGDQRAIDGAASDRAGIEWADACVLVMPCGRSAHLELGYALGLGKAGAVLLSDGEPELMYRLADLICVSIEELLFHLKRKREQP